MCAGELSELSVTVTKVEGLSGAISIFSEETRNAKVSRVALHQQSYSRWIQFSLASLVTAAGIAWLLL